MEKYIIFCGYAGLKGSLMLIKNYQEELNRYFNNVYLKSIEKHIKESGYYGRYLSPINNDRPKDGPVDINNIFAGFSGEKVDVGEGGILKAVYDFAKSHGCGFEIEIKKISTIQICIEICEYFGLNIYRLLSAGKILLSEDPISDCKYLEENGITAQVIGHITDSLDKLIVDKENVEYVNKTVQDEIFKVIRDEREDIIGN
jgi:putative hydrogenase maturation factor